jgi:hypothetical protein
MNGRPEPVILIAAAPIALHVSAIIAVLKPTISNIQALRNVRYDGDQQLKTG